MRYLLLFIALLPAAYAETVYVYEGDPFKAEKQAFKKSEKQRIAREIRCAERGPKERVVANSNIKYESYEHCIEPVTKPSFPTVRKHKVKMKQAQGRWGSKSANYLETVVYPVARRACKELNDSQACELRAALRSYFSQRAPMHIHESAWPQYGYNKNGYKYIDEE